MFVRQHNQARASHFLYVLTNLNIESTKQQKEGNSDGSMGSKSKMDLMKSYKINKKKAEQKLKNKIRKTFWI